GQLGRVLLIGLMAAWLCGCGGGQATLGPAEAAEAKQSSTLTDVAEAYRVYSITKNQPPKKAADMDTVAAIGGNGVPAVRAGEIVVQWGATLPDTNEEPGKNPSPQVLAYWKQVPEQGGYVLMLDRTVKKMTAEEFKAAPKAGAK